MQANDNCNPCPSGAKSERARVRLKASREVWRSLAEAQARLKERLGVRPTTWETIGLLFACAFDALDSGRLGKEDEGRGPKGLDQSLRWALAWHETGSPGMYEGPIFNAERDIVLQEHGRLPFEASRRSFMERAIDCLGKEVRAAAAQGRKYVIAR